MLLQSEEALRGAAFHKYKNVSKIDLRGSDLENVSLSKRFLRGERKAKIG